MGMSLTEQVTVARFRYEAVITRDRSSGRLHTRVHEIRADESVRRTLTDERCQADQSGAFDIVPISEVGTVMENAEPDAVCSWCGSD